MRDSKLIRVILQKEKPFKNLCPEISHYRGNYNQPTKFLYKACGVNHSEYTDFRQQESDHLITH